MAAAIPAAIGVGSSLIGGIRGKGAAKKQQKLAEQQFAQLQPLIQAQILASQFGLNQAQSLYPQAESMFGETYRNAMSQGNEALGSSRQLSGMSLPYLRGAGEALGKLQEFYRPFMFDGQRAIDRFLPSKQRTEEMLAPEFGDINQGYQSASENIAKFAPRGGGRVSTLAKGDLDRQKAMSDTFFRGRESLRNSALGAAFQGASGQQNVANSLQGLGLGVGQLGQNSFSQALQALGIGQNSAQGIGNLGTTGLGMGLGGGQGAINLYGQQANRAYGSQPQGTSGKGLGGFLVDLFNDTGMQGSLSRLFKGSKGGGRAGLTGLWGGEGSGGMF
jgi:hypothetical protein